MAAPTIWQPREAGLGEICSLLEQHISPSSNQSLIWQQLQHYIQLPDFNNYLAFIFARAEGNLVEIQLAAGLLLKNNLRSVFKSLDPAYQQYIKSELLPCIGSADKHIRTTVGTIISVIVEQGGLCSWPELLQALVQCLDSNDINLMEGSLDTLSKICEDIPQELISDAPGLVTCPINVFLPRLFQFFQSPHASLRKLSLESIDHLLVLMPNSLYSSMNQYIQALFILGHDPAAEVRKLVCSAFVQIGCVNPSILEPHLRNIIEFMLQANKDTDDEVALQACEFWSTYCEAQLNPDLLKEFLQHLIPILLSNMVYAEDDESLVDAEEDESIPDRDQDLKPWFHSSQFHGLEDVKDHDDDSFYIRNLRKCSATALQVLSEDYENEILLTLIPLVQAKLSDSDDGTWKEREAAVLALGAIAEGCIKCLYPYLAEIVESLIPLLDDKFPLLRSITCWTLSRFSRSIVRGARHQKGRELFNIVLTRLLRRILDTNKWVQEAACSAFAKLEEEAAGLLAPHLEIIIHHLLCAFGRYQRRNLRIVYDTISALADAVGEKLNQARYIQILMPPLFSKWEQLTNSDKDLCPLLECLSSVVQALGTGFAQFAEPVFQRCINIIRSQLLAKVDSVSAGVHYDKEFIACSLDLVSSIVLGLGGRIENMIWPSNLRHLLLQCCMHDDLDVQQSAFALLGDIARVCPGYLHPQLTEFLNVSTRQLASPQLKESVSVANNACWAIGELAVKVRQEVSPVAMTVISSLAPILQRAEDHNRSFVENSAVTLGRLALVCPETVSPHMEHFMQSWCTALTMIRDDIQREEAFHGLCAIVRANPYGALNLLVYICKAIASWNVVTNETLRNEFSQVLHGYKQMLGDGAWQQYLSALEDPLRQELLKYYPV